VLGEKGWDGHVARMREMRNANNIFVRKSEGNRQLEILKPRWKDNNKMNLKEKL